MLPLYNVSEEWNSEETSSSLVLEVSDKLALIKANEFYSACIEHGSQNKVINQNRQRPKLANMMVVWIRL